MLELEFKMGYQATSVQMMIIMGVSNVKSYPWMSWSLRCRSAVSSRSNLFWSLYHSFVNFSDVVNVLFAFFRLSFKHCMKKSLNL